MRRAGGLCRRCLQAADCPVGATGTFRSCTNFTCVYACSTQQGFKTCPDGSCLPNDQCCGGCAMPCTECVGGTCQCPQAGQQFCGGSCVSTANNPDHCGGGCRFVDGQICGGSTEAQADALCASNNCSERFIDGDGDGAGSTVLFLQRGNTADPGFATVGGDLDDADPTVQ